MTPTLMAENKEEELKSLLMKVKRESEKAGLKLNIQKTMTMASGPFISWQIDGGRVETVKNFIFLGSKIIMDNDLSREIKRCLLLERKDKPKQNIKKQRGTKGPLDEGERKEWKSWLKIQHSKN